MGGRYGFTVEQQARLMHNCPQSCDRDRIYRMVGDMYLLKLKGAVSKVFGQQPLRARLLDIVHPIRLGGGKAAPAQWVLSVEMTGPMVLALQRSNVGKAARDTHKGRHSHSNIKGTSVCFFKQDWFIVDGVTNATKDPEDRTRTMHAILQARATRKDVLLKKGFMATVFDPDTATATDFIILKSPRAQIRAGAKVSSLQIKGEPIRFQNAVVNQTGLRRFGFISRRPSTSKFWIFAKHGIIPVENARYDLHYLFNQIMQSRSTKDALHPSMLAWLQGLFAGNKALLQYTGSMTYESRMSDAMNLMYCDIGNKGITTDDPRARSFPTPAEMMQDPFFAVLKLGPGHGTPTLNRFLVLHCLSLASRPFFSKWRKIQNKEVYATLCCIPCLLQNSTSSMLTALHLDHVFRHEYNNCTMFWPAHLVSLYQQTHTVSHCVSAYTVSLEQMCSWSGIFTSVWSSFSRNARPCRLRIVTRWRTQD